uniref:CCHC-type domain-containing protein n=1 Tax=Globisporangium ultimum (strain ATCC 200006 / CBS 805.95 / DAOM BR144) TaxID=431595 RepID=K3WK66_GLOUD
MGAANSVRKLTVDSIALLEQLEPNADELQKKRQVREYMQHVLAQEWPLCRVLPFGSSESGIGFGGSDVDLGIYFEDVDCQAHFSMEERIQILSTACERLRDAFEIKEFIRNARVPVLKLWDPKRQIACDLCVGGVNALLNTTLIKYYGQIDPRVRPLMFAVKYWAKQRGINDSVNGTLSSYGFSLLLIFYLQSHHSPILLPSVHSVFQSLQLENKISTLLQRLNALPCDEMQSTFGTSVQDSVGALLLGFFQFYASQFNIEDEVVSVRTGAPLSKATKWSHSVPWRISIEDPFELTHDVGRVIFNRKGQGILNFEFQRAFDMVCQGHRLDTICAADVTSWNVSASCYICEGNDHKARECMAVHRRVESTKGDAASFMSDCWYCGELGHFKAACPMLCFRDIPLLPEAKATARVDNVPFTTSHRPYFSTHGLFLPPSATSQPINIAQRSSSQSTTPTRSSKKKKRSRIGSPVLSPSVSPAPLASPLLLSEKRPKRRYQQQQHFALVSATRMCGDGKKWGAAKPAKLNVVCTT